MPRFFRRFASLLSRSLSLEKNCNGKEHIAARQWPFHLRRRIAFIESPRTLSPDTLGIKCCSDAGVHKASYTQIMRPTGPLLSVVLFACDFFDGLFPPIQPVTVRLRRGSRPAEACFLSMQLFSRKQKTRSFFEIFGVQS